MATIATPVLTLASDRDNRALTLRNLAEEAQMTDMPQAINFTIRRFA